MNATTKQSASVDSFVVAEVNYTAIPSLEELERRFSYRVSSVFSDGKTRLELHRLCIPHEPERGYKRFLIHQSPIRIRWDELIVSKFDQGFRPATFGEALEVVRQRPDLLKNYLVVPGTFVQDVSGESHVLMGRDFGKPFLDIGLRFRMADPNTRVLFIQRK